MSDCQHPAFDAGVNVAKSVFDNWIVMLEIRCKECNKPFYIQGQDRAQKASVLTMVSDDNNASHSYG